MTIPKIWEAYRTVASDSNLKNRNWPLVVDRLTKTHGFTFTPSFSVWIETESTEELERPFTALAEGGAQLMPLGDYGFSRRFGWVNDRFGVSWQLNLA